MCLPQRFERHLRGRAFPRPDAYQARPPRTRPAIAIKWAPAVLHPCILPYIPQHHTHLPTSTTAVGRSPPAGHLRPSSADSIAAAATAASTSAASAAAVAAGADDSCCGLPAALLPHGADLVCTLVVEPSGCVTTVVVIQCIEHGEAHVTLAPCTRGAGASRIGNPGLHVFPFFPAHGSHTTTVAT
jgi:hypothetical protein